MEFLWPILAKIELICQQPQVNGAHPRSGVPERMTGGWWGGLAMMMTTFISVSIIPPTQQSCWGVYWIHSNRLSDGVKINYSFHWSLDSNDMRMKINDFFHCGFWMTHDKWMKMTYSTVVPLCPIMSRKYKEFNPLWSLCTIVSRECNELIPL